MDQDQDRRIEILGDFAWCEVCGDVSTNLVNDVFDTEPDERGFIPAGGIHSQHSFCGEHARDTIRYQARGQCNG